MAIRTSQANVAKIIELDADLWDDDFAVTANELVTEMCTGDNGPSTAYTDARLELIERWLAAHFYAINDMRAASEKAGSVSANYQHKVDLNLANTMYGQQAMVLDTNGGLRSIGAEEPKRRKVDIGWLGSTKKAGATGSTWPWA